MIRVFRKRNGQRGQVAIFITLTLVAMFGLLGFVVDFGWAYWRKEAAKVAAESATSAVIQRIKNYSSFVCEINVPCLSTSCTTPLTSPPDITFHAPFQAACLYAQTNGYTSSGKKIVALEGGTGAPPVTGLATPDYWVKATVTETIPQTFSAILGQMNAKVSVSSVGAVFLHPAGACVYALNTTASPAVNTVGSTNVSTGCGIWINSNAANALQVNGSGVITETNGATVKIVGNYDTSGGGAVSPAPMTGQSLTNDPFASIPFPTSQPHACDSTGLSGAIPKNGAGSITMGADGWYVICGNISLTGNQHQYFPAGKYYITDGAGGNSGITWNNGSVDTVNSGDTVTFFLTASSDSNYGGVSISGNVDINLNAPTTGLYRGLLFFQNRTLTTTNSSFTGGSGQNMNGTIYFPTSHVEYAGNSTTAFTGLVADTISFKGDSTLRADTNGSHTGLGMPSIAWVF